MIRAWRDDSMEALVLQEDASSVASMPIQLQGI